MQHSLTCETFANCLYSRMFAQEESPPPRVGLVNGLRALLHHMPNRAFPGEGMPLHPELAEQLQPLAQRTFLDRVLLQGIHDEHLPFSSYASLCLLVDSLLTKWRSARSSLLNVMVFSTPLLPRLWEALQSTRALEQLLDREVPVMQRPVLCGLVSLFCRCYSHLLVILDDEEFASKPFTTDKVVEMVKFFKQLLYRLYWSDTADQANLPANVNAPANASARAHGPKRPLPVANEENSDSDDEMAPAPAPGAQVCVLYLDSLSPLPRWAAIIMHSRNVLIRVIRVI